MTSVTVPIVTTREIQIPKVLMEILKKGFRCNCEGSKHPIAIASDFDDTLVAALDGAATKRTIDGQAVEPPILTILRHGIPFIVITAASQEDMERRLVEPVRHVLSEEGNIKAMQNLTVYPNLGAIRCCFNAQGEMDVAGAQVYKQQFVIPSDDADIISRVLEQVGGQYWQRYRDNQTGMAELYPHFGFREPRVVVQGAVKMTLSPLPGQERMEAIRAIKETLENSGHERIKYQYLIAPGGRSTIDIVNRRINKGYALADVLRLLGIPRDKPNHVVYFGDSFAAKWDSYGSVHKGNDLPVLELGNVVFAIGVNINQAELLPASESRVFPGGSGPAATAAWLAKFAQYIIRTAEA